MNIGKTLGTLILYYLKIKKENRKKELHIHVFVLFDFCVCNTRDLYTKYIGPW